MSEHDLSIGGQLPHIAVLGAGGDDSFAYDSDGDGVTDVVQWNFADGTWQELRDVDGDGTADLLLIDTNGDDTADVQIWDNGDGTYTAAQDADGDGHYESEQSFTRAELDAAIPGVADLLDSQFGAGADGSADPPPVGTPPGALPAVDPEATIPLG